MGQIHSVWSGSGFPFYPGLLNLEGKSSLFSPLTVKSYLNRISIWRKTRIFLKKDLKLIVIVMSGFTRLL